MFSTSLSLIGNHVGGFARSFPHCLNRLFLLSPLRSLNSSAISLNLC